MNKTGFLLVLALFLFTLPCAMAQHNLPQQPGQQPPKEDPRKTTPLTEMQPWLAWDKLSTWKQEVTRTSEDAATDELGVYPVGDGWCYGHIGLGRRANTMQGLIGPSYRPAVNDQGDGTFGSTTFDLLIDGQPCEMPQQKTGMVRGAPVIWTEEANSKGIALRGATWAWSGPKYPEGMEGVEAGKAALNPFRCEWGKAPYRTIYRIYEIYNGTDKPLKNIQLAARFNAPNVIPKPGYLLFSCPDQAGRERRLQIRFSNRSQPKGNDLFRSFDLIEPGKFGRAVMVMHFFYADQTQPDPDDYLTEDCIGAMAETHGWWHLRLKDTTRFRSDNRRVADLVLNWKVMATTMQALPGGGISPMVNQHGVFARDQGGMLLAFLRFGMWDEARAILDYYYKCVRLTGKVQRCFPSSMDFPKTIGDPRWDQLQIVDNETAAWILLQHYWYYRATSDWKILHDRWPFLEQLVKAQKPIDGCLFPIPPKSDLAENGLGALFPDEVGYPNQLIAHLPEKGRTAWSHKGSMFYVLTLHGIADIAGVVAGKCEGEEKGKWEKLKSDYLQKALTTSEKLEEKFWLPTPGVKQEPGKVTGHYAIALGPDRIRKLTQPCASVNLEPFWIGYLFHQGNRDTASVKETIALLPQHGARVGSTPSVGHIMGYTQGYLIGSLTQIEDRSLPGAVDELLKLASPSGGWARIYRPNGKPGLSATEKKPLRHRPWSSGVNLDAMLLALSGIRYAAVPAFDPTTLRLNLRLPGKGKFFAIDGVKHDNRLFDFSIHRHGDRVKVRVLNRGTVKADLALSLLHSMYIRYLEPNQDVLVDEVAPGVKVDDKNPGYREDVFAKSKQMTWFPRPLPLPKPGTNTLFITHRPQEAEKLQLKGTVHTVDVGLPITPDMLAQMIISRDGKLRVQRVLFDTAVRVSSRRTMKNYSFWQAPELHQALQKFRAAGGTVTQR